MPVALLPTCSPFNGLLPGMGCEPLWQVMRLAGAWQPNPTGWLLKCQNDNGKKGLMGPQPILSKTSVAVRLGLGEKTRKADWFCYYLVISTAKPKMNKTSLQKYNGSSLNKIGSPDLLHPLDLKYMEQLDYGEDQDQTYRGSKVVHGNHDDACRCWSSSIFQRFHNRSVAWTQNLNYFEPPNRSFLRVSIYIDPHPQIKLSFFVMSKSSKNSSSSKWNSSNFRSWLLVNDSSPWAAWSLEKHPAYSTRLEGNYCSNVERTSPSDWLGVDRRTLFHRWISDFFGLNGTKKLGQF